MAREKSSGSGQVRSLTRGLTLMRHLAESADGLTLTDLAETAGLPPSTTHRLLTTLEAERFVRADPTGGLWRVGVSAFMVGSAFTRSRDLLTLSRPYLRRLTELSGETANLFVESDGEAICIAQVESSHTMRAITGVGGRLLLHTSAAGKVLLAFVDAARRAEMLGSGPLVRLTDSTIHDPAVLERALAEIRADGFGIDEGEHAPGLRCVAAPVFDEHGEIAAAVSISGPGTRIARERLPQLGRHVAAAAIDVTRDYGGRAPDTNR